MDAINVTATPPQYPLEAHRRPAPQMNPFRSFVTEELQRRKLLPNTIQTPFVRFVSCLSNPSDNSANQYQYFTMGLHGYTDDDVNIFDMTYGSSREILGYAYRNGQKVLIDASQLSRAPFIEYRNQGIIDDAEYHELEASADVQSQRQQTDRIPGAGTFPMPGITEVSIERFAMGAGVRALVKWQCYNRQQLEFLRHHFMMAGNFVVLEFGQQFADKKLEKTLDFSDPSITDTLATSVIVGRKYILQNYVYPNGGNYDYLVGNVGNFTVGYDAQRNTYLVTTTVVASGEMLFGLSIPQTAFNVNPDGNDALVVSTFEEYFQQGGRFDEMITYTPNIGINVSIPIANLDGQIKNFENTNKDIDLSEVSRNPHDYQFISWTFFTRDIIKDMLHRIGMHPTRENQYIRKELNNFFSFYDANFTGSATPHSPTPSPQRTPGAASSQTPGSGEHQLWVGNNVHLKSTDPETMLIIQKTMVESPGIPDDLKAAGFFDQYATDRGLLTNGVWLNVKMIRECFLASSTFEQAMRSILIRMNNAAAGYWALTIYHDDDNGAERIIDEKFASLQPPLVDGRIYQFNVQTKGECLKIDLDSAYPPEVVTQLMIVAKLKSDPSAFTTALQKYPLFGLTSHYAMAMNWTNLQDLVFERIQAARKNQDDGTDWASTPEGTTGTRSGVVSNVGTITGRNTQGLTQANPPPGQSPATGTPSNPNSPAASPSEATIQHNAGIRPSSPANISHLYTKIQTWQPAIDAVKHYIKAYEPRFQFDSDLLIKSFIAQESGGTNGLARPEPHLDDKYGYAVYDLGLMQVLNVNQFALQNMPSTGTTDERRDALKRNLQNDANLNIRCGVQYLVSLFDQAPSGDLEFVIAAYNAGPRGAAHRYQTGNELPIPIDWKDQLTPVIYGPVIPGSFANQSYVNNVLNYYNQFLKVKHDSGTPTTIAGGTPAGYRAIVHPTTLAGLTSNQAQEFQDQLVLKLTFGDTIIALCELNRTNMMNTIIKDGLARHDQKISNSYVAPFPTTAKIDVTIVGISGISIFDVFSVDKLPYMYDQYGIFHVTQINEAISSAGWRTQLHGVFRFLFFNPAQSQSDLLKYITY